MFCCVFVFFVLLLLVCLTSALSHASGFASSSFGYKTSLLTLLTSLSEGAE